MPVGGGDQTNRTYRITQVPEGCDLVKVDDVIRVYVTDPPPLNIILNYGRGCDGVVAVLVAS